MKRRGQEREEEGEERERSSQVSDVLRYPFMAAPR